MHRYIFLYILELTAAVPRALPIVHHIYLLIHKHIHTLTLPTTKCKTEAK